MINGSALCAMCKYVVLEFRRRLIGAPFKPQDWMGRLVKRVAGLQFRVRIS